MKGKDVPVLLFRAHYSCSVLAVIVLTAPLVYTRLQLAGETTTTRTLH